MKHGTIRATLPGATIALAFASPAHASLNDQFVCATEDDRRVHVTIMATDPGKAVLSYRAPKSSEAERITLSGAEPGRAFRFDAGKTRFMGTDTVGILHHKGEQLTCIFPGAPDEGPAKQVDPMVPSVMVDSEGLMVRRYDIGADIRHAFGTPKNNVIAYLSRYLGTPGPLQRNEECGVGPLEFRRFGPITLSFQDNAFAGWFMREGVGEARSVAVSLPDGTRTGDPASSVKATFERFDESTLGEEYTSEGVTALLDETGERVDVLMAGANCVFR